MPDMTRLESDLRDRYPERWVRHHLDSFTEAYFTAFDNEEVAQHLGLVRELDDEHLVFARAWPAVAEGEARGEGEAGSGSEEIRGERWWIEVVGSDAFQFLSTLCNLLAVYGLSIVEGRVFTSQPPPREPSTTVRRSPFRPGTVPASRPSRPREKEPDRRCKVVDRFLVRRSAEEVAAASTSTSSSPATTAPSIPPAPDWAAFEAELQSLARLLREGHHDEVHQRLIGRVAVALRRQRGEEPAFEPLDLTIDPKADATATVVHVGARDSFGFLSLTASALALCGIVIVQADIRTDDGRVDDTLWVTDRGGHKIEDELRLRELRFSVMLIDHFSSRLHRAANPKAALVHFSRFATDTMARSAWAEAFTALDRPEVLDALVRVLGESDFLWEDYLHARPEDLLPMICNPADWRRRDRGELSAELAAALAEARDHDGRAEVLRRFKDRAVFRAGFRAILGRASATDTLAAELSDAAEVLLQAAYDVAAAEVGNTLPRRDDGRVAPSALFALGKCGGRELGIASDLEVMLVHDDRRVVETAGAPSVVAAFDGFVAALRRLLAGRKGSTFELDFRLRPYGRAGAPATSVSAFADYYRSDGPAWGYERQALIKLRAIAGDPALIAEVEGLRDRFVYGPTPFDLEGYRRIRRLQVEQRVQPGRINAKFSPGALVDVEYFVQALQIAHGRRDPSLRTPSTLGAIAALGASGRLAAGDVATLRDCYRFFRALIDALRIVHGHAQDLTVPLAESEEFVLLARRMRRPDPDALQAELLGWLAAVQAIVGRLEEFLGDDRP